MGDVRPYHCAVTRSTGCECPPLSRSGRTWAAWIADIGRQVGTTSGR